MPRTGSKMTCALIACVLAVAGCGSAASGAKQATAGPGGTVNINGVDFSVNNAKKCISAIGSDSYNHDAQGTYVVVTLGGTNKGSAPVDPADLMVYLVDTRNRTYDPDSSLETQFGVGEMDQVINPGSNQIGTYVWDVPTDRLANIQVAVQPRTNGPGGTITLDLSGGGCG